MAVLKKDMKYIIVSPVKDEEKYVENTLSAVLRQTVKPWKWIIVDDGSRDGTGPILERYAAKEDWITVLTLSKDSARQPGSGVIRAFTAGYDLILEDDFDFIVKLDCDLDFKSDYFEQLLLKFQEEEKLGIASGVYWEKQGNKWRAIKMPAYHAAGASKVLRAECFRQIGGFVPSRGWDAVDEIKAQARGWKTTHFEELQLRHLKAEGSGIGNLRTNFMSGEIHYLTGGGTLFFFFKALHRMLHGKPFFLGGIVMVWGFLKNRIRRKKKLVSKSEAEFYRKLLNRRIVSGIQKIVGRLEIRRKVTNFS